ncbi:MAG: hypothetical protein GY863_00780 [bacterium]|nr:hypothetical protein [bacterium]
MSKAGILTAILLLISTGQAPGFQADTLRTHNISISTNISNTEVPSNQTIDLTVIISWEGAPDRFEMERLENPELINLEIMGSQSLSRSEIMDDKVFTIREFTFNLSPVERGMGYIEGMTIRYKDRATNKRDFLSTQRLNVKGLPPIYPKDYGWVWKVVIVIIVVGFSAGIAIPFLMRRKKKVETESEPEVPAEERYMEELVAIKDKNSLSYRQRLDDVTAVFRNYLSEKYNIPEGSRSEKALVEFLYSEGIEETLTIKIKGVFDQAEQFRFSGTEINVDRFELIFGSIESCIETCSKNV